MKPVTGFIFLCMLLMQSGCDIVVDAAHRLGIYPGLIDDAIIEHPGPQSCSVADYNQYLYDYMKTYYYWYDQVDPGNLIDPTDTTAYPTSQDLLLALRYDVYDHFSGISDAATFTQFYGEGQFLGVGLRLLFDDLSGDVMVAYAYDGSPAASAGLQRGDRLLTINGYTANGLSGADWTAAWGVNTVGTVVTLVIERQGVPLPAIDVTKDIVTINTTQGSGEFQANGKNVGYLHFTNFLGNDAILALQRKFDDFNSYDNGNGIDELIVDLRYNGGGQVSTASYFGDLLANSAAIGNIFTRLIYNDNPAGFNGYSETYNFSDNSRAPRLSRVFFITSPATCSASELLINALAPYGIEVVLVGDTTCGKPMGFRTETYCNKTLLAVNFEIRNGNNVGEYYSGIGPGYSEITNFCNASDDLTNPLGNIAEASVASALSYMQTSSCPAARAIPRHYRSSPDRDAEQVYQFNAGMY